MIFYARAIAVGLAVTIQGCSGTDTPVRVRNAIINGNSQMDLARGALDRAREGETTDLGAGLAVVMGTAPCASGGTCYSCFQCHGVSGAGSGVAAFPRLAGLESRYLVTSLEQFRSGERPSHTMEEVARGLTPSQMRAAAAYFSALRAPTYPVPIASELRAAAESTGRRIAEEGCAEQGVPPCTTCHGWQVRSAGAAYPDISGQYADYLVMQLEQFRSGQRKGADAEIMQTVARNLTAEQSRVVATYYSLQPAQPIDSAHLSARSSADRELPAPNNR